MTPIEIAEAANELSAHADMIARLDNMPRTNAAALAFHRGEALTLLNTIKLAILL